jgi:hypothetical protein
MKIGYFLSGEEYAPAELIEQARMAKEAHNADIDAELEQAVVGIKAALEHEPTPLS